LRAALALALVLGPLLAGCGGSDDAPDAVAFVPFPRPPGAGQVFLSADAVSGATTVLSVRVRSVAGLAATDLRLEYDPTIAVFRGFSAGTLLEGGDGLAAYVVGETEPGRLRIAVTRTGPGTVDAGEDDPPVVRLTFTAGRRASGQLVFAPESELLGPTGPIPDVELYGGTLVGS
jgi:hypothetical protein